MGLIPGTVWDEAEVNAKACSSDSDDSACAKGQPPQPTRVWDGSVTQLTDERGEVYGHPSANFNCIGDMYAIYLNRKADAGHDTLETTAIDVAVFNILQKISRIAQTPNHLDSWRDVEGYARCAIQCLTPSNSTGLEGTE